MFFQRKRGQPGELSALAVAVEIVDVDAPGDQVVCLRRFHQTEIFPRQGDQIFGFDPVSGWRLPDEERRFLDGDHADRQDGRLEGFSDIAGFALFFMQCIVETDLRDVHLIFEPVGGEFVTVGFGEGQLDTVVLPHFTNTPVVIGETQSETKDVFIKKAQECNAPIYFADQIVDCEKIHIESLDYQKFDIWKDNELYIEAVEFPLLGYYQKKNLATVICAIELLKEKFNIEKKDIVNGLEYVVKNTNLIKVNKVNGRRIYGKFYY